jgi:exopolyphosphatase/guanosine-5'-triphosphate,3'-diphosphate pyrophosphatase
MVGDASSLVWATSVPLGVARLSADFVHSDPISKRDRRALREHIDTVLGPVVAEVSSFEPKLAVGSSGTLESLAEMVAARRDEDTPTTLNQLTIDRSEFLSLHQVLMASKAADRLRLDDLDARRVDLIVAGSMVLATAMDAFGFDQLTISEWALREGIVLDTVRLHDPTEWSDDPHSIRGSAVLSLARRCNWSEAHARQVAMLALALFDATAELHGLGDADRELLEFAALLHDIGEHVASSGHHKHGAYLVRNGQLRGFAPDEVELLAAVVRWHRRGDPRVSDEFPLLDAHAIERVRVLAAILRVADGLDRSRNQNVYGLDVMITPSLVLLRLRAVDDAELEIWGARRKRALLEKVLDRELELTTHPSVG